jgi:hypothetical protein
VRACLRIASAVLAASTVAGCGLVGRSGTDPAGAGTPYGAASGTPTAGNRHVVVYEVTGKVRKADVTYSGSDELTEVSEGRSLPWKKRVTFDDGAADLTLTAIGDNDGRIACRITVDGKQVARKTSEYLSIVACEASIK